MKRGFRFFWLSPVIGLLLAGATQAASAPFRVLYSNDTTNIQSSPSPGHLPRDPFTVERLNISVDEAAGADAHLLQPGMGWVPWWKSRIYPADEHYRWMKDTVGLSLDPISQFMLEGGDLVAPFVEHSRKRGIAPFVSFRLNDYHGNEALDYLARLARGEKGNFRAFDRVHAAAQSRMLIEHPEYRLRPDPEEYVRLTSDEERLAYIGTMRKRINLRTARIWNWAKPEVPAYKLGLIRELCENYDFAGLELDFMRWSAFFRLEETTAEQRVGIMVAFIREVRAALDRAASGGPRRWLCVRVPLRLSGHAPLGVDLPRWTAAGVDMVNLSCHYTTEQQSELPPIRQLIPNTPVYLEMTFVSARYPKPDPGGSPTHRENVDVYRKMTDEQFYTTAHLVHARGGSGVSLFNFVYYRSLADRRTEPPFHVLPRLGDPAWLARQPQHYFMSDASNPPSQPSVFHRNKELSRERPSVLPFDLAPPQGGWKADGRLRIQSVSAFTDHDISVRGNGRALPLTADVSEPYASPYSDGIGTPETQRAWVVPREWLRDGVNTFEITLSRGKAITLVYADLAIR